MLGGGDGCSDSSIEGGGDGSSDKVSEGADEGCVLEGSIDIVGLFDGATDGDDVGPAPRPETEKLINLELGEISWMFTPVERMSPSW